MLKSLVRNLQRLITFVQAAGHCQNQSRMNKFTLWEAYWAFNLSSSWTTNVTKPPCSLSLVFFVVLLFVFWVILYVFSRSDECIGMKVNVMILLWIILELFAKHVHKHQLPEKSQDFIEHHLERKSVMCCNLENKFHFGPTEKNSFHSKNTGIEQHIVPL